MNNYYEILGVSNNSSNDEIKSLEIYVIEISSR